MFSRLSHEKLLGGINIRLSRIPIVAVPYGGIISAHIQSLLHGREG